jgi:hypothetical protein
MQLLPVTAVLYQFIMLHQAAQLRIRMLQGSVHLAQANMYHLILWKSLQENFGFLGDTVLVMATGPITMQVSVVIALMEALIGLQKQVPNLYHYLKTLHHKD